MADSMSMSIPPEGEPDTYHDRQTLSTISVHADRLSLLFLILFVAVAIFIFTLIWRYATGRMVEDQFFAYFLYALVPLLLGGFFWVALRAISEGIYLMMDIEDNTRSFLGWGKNQPQ